VLKDVVAGPTAAATASRGATLATFAAAASGPPENAQNIKGGRRLTQERGVGECVTGYFEQYLPSPTAPAAPPAPAAALASCGIIAGSHDVAAQVEFVKQN